MSSFWSTSSGDAITATKEYEASAGDFEPIPKNTNVLVMIEDVAWKPGYQVSEEFVNLKCRVMKPEAYANRVLFFKLWADELDPGVKDKQKAETKQEKHKRMLMAIDANGKGRLGRAAGRPTNDELALALTNVQFVATLGVWDKEDEQGRKVPGGNWLQACKAKNAEVTQVEKPATKRVAPVVDFDDSDVPF